MKKSVVLVMIFLAIFSWSVSGYYKESIVCFNNNIVELNSNVELLKEDEYVFIFNGINIKMNDSAKNVLQKLGKEKQYFESPSCAFQGLDKVYTYNSFEVTTYSMNNVDYIESVFLLDDTVKTVEGIALYQSLEEMKRVYGSNYEEVNGIYTYKKGKTKLSFMIKKDKIVQIEYKAIVK